MTKSCRGLSNPAVRSHYVHINRWQQLERVAAQEYEIVVDVSALDFKRAAKGGSPVRQMQQQRLAVREEWDRGVGRWWKGLTAGVAAAATGETDTPCSYARRLFSFPA